MKFFIKNYKTFSLAGSSLLLIFLAATLTFFSIPMLAAPDNTTGGNTNNTTTNNTTNNTANITGFDGQAWGSKFEDVLKLFRDLARNSTTAEPVSIVNVVENKEVSIKRSNIDYKYIFYKVDKDVAEIKKKENANTAIDETPRLFFVESRFAGIQSEEMFEHLQKKYGRYTKSIVDDQKRGAYLWELADGFIVQWIEPYNKETYTTRIFYLSKNISDEIQKDYKIFQFAVERKVIDALIR